MKIRCISIHQPWASLVAVGAKTFETRHWPTKYRGPLAIHAAARLGPAQHEALRDERFQRALKAVYGNKPHPNDPSRVIANRLPYGCIVCVCRLEDCHETKYLDLTSAEKSEAAFGDFSPGRFAWELTDVRALKTPFVTPGRQGFWAVDLPEGCL